jgi:hypothetical protein
VGENIQNYAFFCKLNFVEAICEVAIKKNKINHGKVWGIPVVLMSTLS